MLRRAAVVTQRPLRWCIPAPQAWWTVACHPADEAARVCDMACADVATAKAKITAMNLIILSSVVNLQEQIA
jgi:pyruvoyl-dependent arginine decarboxylase (PvlArgDC)